MTFAPIPPGSNQRGAAWGHCEGGCTFTTTLLRCDPRADAAQEEIGHILHEAGLAYADLPRSSRLAWT